MKNYRPPNIRIPHFGEEWVLNETLSSLRTFMPINVTSGSNRSDRQMVHTHIHTQTHIHTHTHKPLHSI